MSPRVKGAMRRLGPLLAGLLLIAGGIVWEVVAREIGSAPPNDANIGAGLLVLAGLGLTLFGLVMALRR